MLLRVHAWNENRSRGGSDRAVRRSQPGTCLTLLHPNLRAHGSQHGGKPRGFVVDASRARVAHIMQIGDNTASDGSLTRCEDGKRICFRGEA